MGKHFFYLNFDNYGLNLLEYLISTLSKLVFKLYRYHVSLGHLTYIQYMTADFTVAQMTITDTHHNKGKPQKVVAEKAGCSQSNASNRIIGKLTGRESRTSNTSKNGQEKSIQELGRTSQEPSLVKVFRKVDTAVTFLIANLNQRKHQKPLTWTENKKSWTVAHRSKVLFSDKIKFCILFGNEGFLGLKEERRGREAKVSEVQHDVAVDCDDLGGHTGPLCFIKM